MTQSESSPFIEFFSKKRVLTGVIRGSPSSEYVVSLADTNNFSHTEFVSRGQERFFLPLEDFNADVPSLVLAIYDNMDRSLLHHSPVTIDPNNMLTNLGELKINRLQFLTWPALLASPSIFPFYALLLIMIIFMYFQARLAREAEHKKRRRQQRREKLELLRLLRQRKETLQTRWPF